MESLMSDSRDPLRYLNKTERRFLGWVVQHLFATDNPRFERALEKSGEKATARMACVNALRLYAIVLFVLGTVAKLASVAVLAYGFYGLAAAAMAWSFWCLYTVVGPEREFRRASGLERTIV
jgi:hypothetical protein